MTLSNSDFKAILNYPIKDKQWLSKLSLQVALLFFLCFFLVGIPLLYGYMTRCIQKAIDNDDTLPDWNEWGLFWRLGWKTIAVSLIFGAPVMLAVVLFIIFIILSSLLASLDIINDSWLFVASLLGICMYIFIMLYSVIMSLLQPAYITAIALGRSVRECLQIKQRLWPYIKGNIWALLIGFAIYYLASMISSVGFFAFFIGIFFTFGYAIAAGGYMYGVIYRNSQCKL